jgi:hypothetical protein
VNRTVCLLGTVVAIGLAPITPLCAQAPGPKPAVVQVHVADTSGTPLAGATLTILKARQLDALYVGISDATGRYTFTIEPDSGSYRVVVRKVGYIETARLLPVAPGDTLTVAVRMGRLPREMDTVRVTERQLPSRKYFLGADEIMASTRPIDDAYDAIRALSPVIFTGDGARLCGRVQSVWINGKRWTDSPLGMRGVSVDHTRAVDSRGPPPRQMLPAFLLAPPPRPDLLGTRSVMGLLMNIKKEHIDQIKYVNCWDTSMPGIGGMDAVFVTLKPGIAFDLEHGSYVDSTLTPPPRPPVPPPHA